MDMAVDPRMMQDILAEKSARFNLNGSWLSIGGLEIVFAILSAHGECHIENCGGVSPMELGAYMAGLYHEGKRLAGSGS